MVCVLCNESRSGAAAVTSAKLLLLRANFVYEFSGCPGVTEFARGASRDCRFSLPESLLFLSLLHRERSPTHHCRSSPTPSKFLISALTSCVARHIRRTSGAW